VAGYFAGITQGRNLIFFSCLMMDQAHFLKRSLLLTNLMRILYIREVRGVLACHLARACDVKCLCFKRFSDFGDIGNKRY
jgi:hypothetical protein